MDQCGWPESWSQLIKPQIKNLSLSGLLSFLETLESDLQEALLKPLFSSWWLLSNSK